MIFFFLNNLLVLVNITLKWDYERIQGHIPCGLSFIWNTFNILMKVNKPVCFCFVFPSSLYQCC